MKTFVVAFVATVSFTGIQNNWAAAYSETSFVDKDRLLALGMPYGFDHSKTDNPFNHDWISEEKKLQIQENAKILATQSLESEVAEPEQEQPVVSISDEEKDLFARLVEAEAKGEPYEGKVAVATVVLNRVDSPEFPNTVTEVVNEVVGGTYAFSPVQNGEISKPASDEAGQAVEEALTRKDRLNDSIYFYNPDIATDKWILTRNIVTKIGHHVFAK